VHYVSLKISSVVANLDVLAFDHSVDEISDRLRTLYRAAAVAPATFVNLDMEEYRDLPLTLAAMTRVLDEPEFGGLAAGVVLQAYLPDSHVAGEWLCTWAAARHRRAGGTLKVRIVKGANLGMEKVEAEQHGWSPAPYSTKEEVDASFKRLVLHTLGDRWAAAVTVGFASHNLFDIAWALGLPPSQRARLEFEMLEGMAPAQARAVLAEAGSVLLYAPVVRRDDLPASIAYLTRRLDENTAPDNFMRALFTLRPGSPDWAAQRERFDAAVARIDGVATTPRRQLPRGATPGQSQPGFRNTADTDWALAANRAWLAEHMAAPDEAVPPPTPCAEAVDRSVLAARAAGLRWAATTSEERRTLLLAVADEMERSRGHTLALLARTACKTVAEGDPEVSEAIDFARYYAWCTHALDERIEQGREFTPHGVVLVAAPWNFPFAIPAGGVLAALAAGNAVILKPAPEVRAVGQELVEQMWRAGVPHDLLHYLPTDDDEVGAQLVTHG
jgi:RHH-type proline utilization regulon transcriptional repressor/proline dehydrogenase/delta 1-pyrroline-5-carboxylate dehydrogenase